MCQSSNVYVCEREREEIQYPNSATLIYNESILTLKHPIKCYVQSQIKTLIADKEQRESYVVTHHRQNIIQTNKTDMGIGGTVLPTAC